MKPYNYIFILLLLVGCVTSRPASLENVVINKMDGINYEEAITIAGMELTKSRHSKDYILKSATVRSDLLVKNYKDYWFVSFEPNKFSLSFWDFLVVINKKTGNVKYAEAHKPLVVLNYDWIFE